jgi:hypothetical protein
LGSKSRQRIENLDTYLDSLKLLPVFAMDNLSLEDDDAWHQKEGVPRLEDQFIQKYLDGRDALVAQEKKQRSGK